MPDKTLPPVRPNCGLEALYNERLQALIAEMHRSILYWVSATYRANPPKMAQDASPADELAEQVADLGDRWQKRFDEMAESLGEYFATAAAKRSDAALKAILRKGGFAVKFQMTPAMRDVLKATISEQVGLIKSIPQQYLKDVQGAVMRSVQIGRDLHTLSTDLQKNFGVTKRRAAFIARDQNNKATAVMVRARQTELDITRARWRHSGGAKHPRPSHVKASNDRVTYDVRKGWYDPHLKKRIWPGTEPNCGCVSIPIIKGFT